MSKLKTFSKKNRFWMILAAIVVLGYAVYSVFGHNKPTVVYATAAVTKGNLITTVIGTGQVSPLNQINVQSQASGQVTAVDVSAGQYVSAGQTLFVVDQSSARVQVEQAQASLQSAEASLSNAKANLALTGEQQDLAVSNAYENLLNAGIAATPSPNNYSTATPTITGTYTGDATGTYAITLHTISGYKPDNFSISGLENVDNITINPNGTPIPFGTHGLYIQFPSGISLNDSWTVTIPNPNAANYLSNYNAYQSALQAKAQAVQSAEAAVTSSEDAITSAQASLSAAQLQLQNTVVTAPFSGQVAAVNVVVGQSTQSSSTVTLITPEKIAEVSLNEIDAAKVKVGQKATLTFAALPNLTLSGTVAELDELGTVSQGVVTYDAKVALDGNASQVKPGMSVTATIVTNTAKNVLMVPNSAVRNRGNKNFVQVIGSDGKTASQEVQTGASNDTMTQVVRGLTEGEKVVTVSLSAAAASQTAAAPAASGNGRAFFGGGGKGF